MCGIGGDGVRDGVVVELLGLGFVNTGQPGFVGETGAGSTWMGSVGTAFANAVGPGSTVASLGTGLASARSGLAGAWLTGMGLGSMGVVLLHAVQMGSTAGSTGGGIDGVNGGGARVHSAIRADDDVAGGWVDWSGGGIDRLGLWCAVWDWAEAQGFINLCRPVKPCRFVRHCVEHGAGCR